jgi:AraC-like DNA-binding protein
MSKSSRSHQPAGAKRVAGNFIRQHGKARFRRFLRLLQEGVSGEEIAEEFGVSRERVRQWKNTFGESVTSYELDPDIQKIAGMR